jgi:glycosyltransferase involved in cell wall biosynthesis
MKICLVSNLYPPFVRGGAEIYVGRLARALAEDHQVVVVTTEPGFRVAPRREVTPEGIVVYRVAPLNVAHLSDLPHQLLAQAAFRAIDLYHPQVAAAMSHVIGREQPDVIHLHNWVGLSLAALLSGVPSSSPHIPLALTLHDYSLCCIYADLRHADGRGCDPRLPCRAMSVLNRQLTRRVGLAISPSVYTLERHQERGFFRHADRQVIPNGIEALAPPPRPSPARGEGEAASPKGGTFDILYMGRVQSYKGPEVLIRAFRRLAGPSLRLHIAGEGPALDGCRTLAAGDPRIRFYGFVVGEERTRLLSTADCVVLPSLWPENSPVTIQEAFQFGPVVIASRIGGIPEMVREGVNGLLVEPGDEGAVAAAIERLRTLPQLAATLRASAMETARLYDMRFHVAHLLEAYQRLLVSDRVRPFDRRAA